MQIYITDSSGKKYWNTNVAYRYSAGELNNMNRRLDCIKRNVKGFECIDSESAKIVQMLDQDERHEVEMDDEQLLAELIA